MKVDFLFADQVKFNQTSSLRASSQMCWMSKGVSSQSGAGVLVPHPKDEEAINGNIGYLVNSQIKIKIMKF